MESLHKPVAVFGLGKSGIATVEFLNGQDVFVYAWDDNEESRRHLAEEELQGVALVPYEQFPWEEIGVLILSPGIPLTHPEPHPVVSLAKSHEVVVVGDVEMLYLSYASSNFIGVTGTNGKSTTTSLIGHIIEQAGILCSVGGNLGTPALSLEPQNEYGYYVLEVSSYQLDLIDNAHFHIGILLNITPDHLDRHGSMEAYIASKERLFENQNVHDMAIVSVDNIESKKIYERLVLRNEQRLIPISSQHKLEDGIAVIDNVVYDGLEGKSYPLGHLQHLSGDHNAENIAAAFACGKEAGITPEEIVSAIMSFPGLAHRMEYVATQDNLVYVNDSKATNAIATEKALTAFENIYWIVGGQSKDDGITSLTPHTHQVTCAFLIGEAEEEFATTLEGHVPYQKCGTLENAVMQAKALAMKDNKPAVILLSPACASFDQWKDFEERGNAFKTLVVS